MNIHNQSSKPVEHLLYLDGLRGAAALFVVIHHAWLQIWPILLGKKPSGVTWMLTGWILYGHFAVDVFIVLSGFCLTLPVIKNGGLLRGGAKTFYQKRARRILPTYYLACALSLLLIATLIGQDTGTHWDNSVPVSKSAIVFHLLLLQDVFSARVGGQLNHAFWSIAVEWHIYIFFPLLVLLWKKIGPLSTTALATFFAYAAHFLLKDTRYIGITPHYLALFVFGMLGAQIACGDNELWQKVKSSYGWQYIALFLAIFICMCCLVLGWARVSSHFAYIDFLVGLCSMALLIAVHAQPAAGTLRRSLTARPLVFVGTFAYSLYLIHAPLLQVVWQYAVNPLKLNPDFSFLALILVGIPLIVACSYLFSLFCEKPFLSPRAKKSVEGIQTGVGNSL